MTDTNALTMDAPVENSVLDRGAQGVIGKALDRVDGPKKVAGKATYAAEYALDNLSYGYLVRAPFACGRITDIDADAARRLPGVLDVITDYACFIRNPAQGNDTEAPEQGVREVAYFGEPVAIVVAESYEAARDAGEAVRVSFEPGEGRFDFDGRLDEAEQPEDGVAPAHFDQGDLDKAMAEAPHRVDAVWTTPSQNSAAMEPHASTACWDEDGLTLYGAYQMPASDRQQLADALDLPVEQVRIISAYVGGGFGSKLGIAPESVAAALAAKKLGRPVKAVMTRQQVFDATVRRSNTHQRIRLGADAEGRLNAIGHETICSNLPREDFFEPAGIGTHFLYGGANRRITHDIVRMNRLLSGSMRAPGEAAGMLALECAMDELAEAIGLDPVELRKRNDPQADPEKNIPYSTRKFTQCLDEGAARFGWAERNRTPGDRRDGEWLIGHGMAACCRSNMLMPSEARVALTPQGVAVVETDMTDIGTGTYTILTQIAGEMLGLPADRVDVRLGDNRFPPGAGSGGSFGAGSSGSSVYLACQALRRNLAEAMDCDEKDLTLKDGEAVAHNRRVPIEQLIGHGLDAHGRIEPGEMEKKATQASYGAHFCEVAVNAVTGEVRVRRWLSTFAAGRILNEKTARSQCLGGIVFGIGAALTEELVHDARNGKVVNRDLAEYHVATNADVPQIEVAFLPERDPDANPLGSKGIGELGISGAGAAVVNAIYNATGKRVRDYPVTPDKLLDALPPV
ncbi:xanthine dehydrogenase family protein molybdopterin-binding subunit [Stakelama saccharophila]|uniref:Xanthine dehydrogenase family protein molybdopterin-binding subunit n=1 Tax=Stakelama saccharophila TaxID=3075605 RepID=A0ABZ0BAK1_9SPHN|nr:xanthine dehydrogenase family protein molybdopterin-binding subunit [Stakelama sp. W311]WNO54442.1 xanthine dehydrogenase family protein molybdopterin-binding subunit [Stakelama sp. W311]